MKSWKFIKKHESSFDRHCSRNLYEYIKTHPKSYPSTIKELLDICGIKCDFESVKNYQKFHSYLIKQRNQTMNKMEELITHGYFEEYLNNGHTEEEIYNRFIDTCLSYEIIPLYSDSDKKYYLADLNSFIDIIHTRLKANKSEITHKFDMIKTSKNILPETIKNEFPKLDNKPNLDFLPNGDKGTLDENNNPAWKKTDAINPKSLSDAGQEYLDKARDKGDN